MGQCLVWLTAHAQECVLAHNLATKGAKVVDAMTLKPYSSFWNELDDIQRKLINLRNASEGFRIRHLR